MLKLSTELIFTTIKGIKEMMRGNQMTNILILVQSNKENVMQRYSQIENQSHLFANVDNYEFTLQIDTNQNRSF